MRSEAARLAREHRKLKDPRCRVCWSYDSGRLSRAILSNAGSAAELQQKQNDRAESFKCSHSEYNSTSSLVWEGRVPAEVRRGGTGVVKQGAGFRRPDLRLNQRYFAMLSDFAAFIIFTLIT